MWWSRFSKSKPLSLKEVIEPFFNGKNFKSHEKVLKFFSGIKYFKTVMESFFRINNFKKLSFKSFKEP